MNNIIFITELQNLFKENADPMRAIQQARYMKNKFEFYGLTSPIRKELQKPFLEKKHLPEKKEAFKIVRKLWQKPQRELHYFSQELVNKYKKQTEIEDIDFFEWLIISNSWWDTVDFIAVNLVGNYFMNFPEQLNKIINKWLLSDNIWLQRSCVLFQLKYKEKTDIKLLSYCFENLLGTKEFFINKAIGWALRQYSKTDSEWVINFVHKHPKLSNLSTREALRLLNKN